MWETAQSTGSSANRLTILTSAELAIGMGHVVRQLVVAETAMNLGWQVSFLTDTELAMKLIQTKGYPVTKADFTRSEMVRNLLYSLKTTHLIMDVHESTFDSLRACADSYPTILVVSPVGHTFTPFGRAMVMVGSSMTDWTCRQEITTNTGRTRILTGRSWSIFRNEFRSGPGDSAVNRREVLICHGGTDPKHLTRKCLQSLELCQECYLVTILVGRGFNNVDEVKELSRQSKHQCQVYIDSSEVAMHMRNAALALINGGNIRYELCLTATPFLAMGITEGQREYTRKLAQLGAGIDLGLGCELTEHDIASAVDHWMKAIAERQKMQNLMIKLFDMDGAERILSLLTG